MSYFKRKLEKDDELSKLLSRWDFYNEVRNRMMKVKDKFLLEHDALLSKYDARDYYLEIRKECVRVLKELLK